MNNTISFPVVVLENGLRVANFSSPHDFAFEDGNVLEGVTPGDCKERSLRPVEKSTTRVVMMTDTDSVSLEDIEVSFEPTMGFWEALWHAARIHSGDIVLVPLPVLLYLKENWGEEKLRNSPFRGVRVVDRVSKVVSCRKFCV